MGKGQKGLRKTKRMRGGLPILDALKADENFYAAGQVIKRESNVFDLPTLIKKYNSKNPAHVITLDTLKDDFMFKPYLRLNKSDSFWNIRDTSRISYDQATTTYKIHVLSTTNKLIPYKIDGETIQLIVFRGRLPYVLQEFVVSMESVSAASPSATTEPVSAASPSAKVGSVGPTGTIGAETGPVIAQGLYYKNAPSKASKENEIRFAGGATAAKTRGGRRHKRTHKKCKSKRKTHRRRR